MKNIVNQNILKVAPYVPGKPIEEVKRELGLKNVVKLASNENPFGPSAKVLKAIAAESKNLNRYPDGQCFYLRRELAKRLKINPAQLIFGNGSDEIIVMAIRAFVLPDEEVIIARPSFLIYEIAAQAAGAQIVDVPLKNFRYDLEGMKERITPKTKIIFIGNPDNPAGTYVGKNALLNFLNTIRRDILVFIDEAYYEFVRGKDYPQTVPLLKDFKNLIITRTFSKLFGLAGLRIGYGMADSEIIDCLNRVREPFNVNSLAQAAALACLKDGAYYKRIAKSVDEQKEFLYKQLSRMGLSVQPSSTNFILIDVKEPASMVAQALLKKGIIVRDMSPWGMERIIRVTVGTKAENQRFLDALKGIV